jgi:DNA-binding transcriptional MerR regulator
VSESGTPGAKGPNAFRTISEAAEELGVPQHVLRFWETKFSFIRPMKRAGGRRFYRPQDLVLLQGVRRLLHDEGYTIKGVQKLHKEHGLKRLVAAADPAAAATFDEETYAEGAEPVATPAAVAALDRGRLEAVLRDLETAKARLDAVLRS